MKQALFILALCALGCEGTSAPVTDATLDHEEAGDAAGSDDVAVDAPVAQDASMDSNLGADVSMSDASNSADAHD